MTPSSTILLSKFPSGYCGILDRQAEQTQRTQYSRSMNDLKIGYRIIDLWNLLDLGNSFILHNM